MSRAIIIFPITGNPAKLLGAEKRKCSSIQIQTKLALIVHM